MVLTMSVAGCKGKRERVAVQNEEEPSTPKMAMSVRIGDPKAAPQLVTGFYSVENGWRWTSGKFSVLLRPPANAAQAGAVLKLAFAAPDPVMQKVGSLTLDAAINGNKLKPEEYKAAGNYTYSADVPPNLLSGDAVKVDFTLDKTLPPGGADRRELGVIAISAGFEAK